MTDQQIAFNQKLDSLLSEVSEWLPEFTNYADDDPFLILIKLIAALSVSTNAYSDRYLTSKFNQVDATLDRRSMYTLLDTFDMVPTKIIPGTIKTLFKYVGNVPSESIIIPEGTEFDVGGTPFVTVTDFSIKPTSSYVEIDIVQGELITEDFKKSNIAYDNTIALDSQSIATDYVRVYVDGTELTPIKRADWNPKVPNAYSILYTIDGEYTIIFTDATVNTSIADASDISVVYIESDGSADYEPVGDDITITSEVMAYLEPDEAVSDEELEEEEETEAEEEDVAEDFQLELVKGYVMPDTSQTEEFNYSMIPKLLSNFRQAITVQDYQDLVSAHAGVSICAAYDMNSIEASNPAINIKSPYLLKLVVAPENEQYASDELKAELLSYLREVGISEAELMIDIIDPLYVPINISLGINANVTKSEEIDVYSTIKESLEEYFEIGNLKFGATITQDYISTLVAKSDPRIQYVEVLEFGSDGRPYQDGGYVLGPTELPIIDSLNFEFDFNLVTVTDSSYVEDTLTKVLCEMYLTDDRADIAICYDELGESYLYGSDESTADESLMFVIEASSSPQFDAINCGIITTDRLELPARTLRTMTQRVATYTDVSCTDSSSSMTDSSFILDSMRPINVLVDDQTGDTWMRVTDDKTIALDGVITKEVDASARVVSEVSLSEIIVNGTYVQRYLGDVDTSTRLTVREGSDSGYYVLDANLVLDSNREQVINYSY